MSSFFFFDIYEAEAEEDFTEVEDTEFYWLAGIADYFMEVVGTWQRLKNTEIWDVCRKKIAGFGLATSLQNLRKVSSS